MTTMRTNLGLWERNRRNTAWGEEDIEACTTAKRSRGQQLLRNSAMVPPKTRKKRPSQGDPAVQLLDIHPQGRKRRTGINLWALCSQRHYLIRPGRLNNSSVHLKCWLSGRTWVYWHFSYHLPPHGPLRPWTWWGPPPRLCRSHNVEVYEVSLVLVINQTWGSKAGVKMY